MDTLSAGILGMANRGREVMVFDWDTAAKLIKERKPEWAMAGLQSDWGNTGGDIYHDGEPIMDSYTYLASTWAVPELDLDGEVIPCYKMAHEVPNWNSKTKWPESALKILNE